MASRVQRFARLEQIAAISEQQALNKLGSLQSQLTASKSQLQQFLSYSMEYRNLRLSLAKQGIKGATWQQYCSFLQNLDRAISSLEQRIEDLNNAIGQARQCWQQAHNRTTILHNMVIKCSQQELKNFNKKEQQLADELAQRTYFDNGLD